MQGRSLSREERKIQAEMQMFMKMESDPAAPPKPKTPKDKVQPEPDDSKRRRSEEDLPGEDPKRFKSDNPEPVMLKKPGLKGKFGKKAWLQEFQQAEEAPPPPPPPASLSEVEQEKKSHGNLKKKWASTWGDAGMPAMSEEQIHVAQTIENTEAQLKKLRDQRAEPTAAEAEAAAPRQLSALEEQQKRLAEAEERVRRMQQQARERAEIEAKQALAQQAAMEAANQAPAQLIAEAEQRVLRLEQQQQQHQQVSGGELLGAAGRAAEPVPGEPAISYSPPDSWSDGEPAPPAPRAEQPLAPGMGEPLGLAGSKFTFALGEIVYMRRQHSQLYPTCSTSEMMHRLDDVRVESEHRMPSRYNASKGAHMGKGGEGKGSARRPHNLSR